MSFIAKLGAAARGTYVYYYLPRQVRRTNHTVPVTLHYVHDLDGNVIAEYTSAGVLQRDYIWLDERPLAVVADAGTATPKLYFVHTDHLERPVMMTDVNRTVVWQARYLPFGEVYSITGPASLDQRFPGQWFQMETGLHYNWHRHYDPSSGRYMQPDPLGMPDGPSRWAYVANSPLMKVDPDGRFIPALIGAGEGAAYLCARFPVQCFALSGGALTWSYEQIEPFPSLDGPYVLRHRSPMLLLLRRCLPSQTLSKDHARRRLKEAMDFVNGGQARMARF